MCTCYERINYQLQKMNSDASIDWDFDGHNHRAKIAYKWVEDVPLEEGRKRRSQKTILKEGHFISKFCPFCGTRY